ncbi:MAG: alginate export family protein [Opitutae bacterium]|nr:alginate export family protein [Opitutae bacterium]
MPAPLPQSPARPFPARHCAPVFLLSLAVGLAVAEDRPPARAVRPAYQVLRFEENWDVLRGRPADDMLDPLKFIALGDASRAWLSLGGQARWRWETWRNFAFGTPAAPEDDFGLGRIQLHADLRFGSTARFFAELIDARMLGRRALPGGTRAADVNSRELLNAFADFSTTIDARRLTLRLGRQQFSFGRQRLVSPLPWLNTYRHWDGAAGLCESPAARATVFYSWFVPVQKYATDRRNRHERFYGTYVTFRRSTELYLLVRDRPVAQDRRQTFGFRRTGRPAGNWEFDLEAAIQRGSLAGKPVRAWMLGSELGYTAARLAWKPRFAAGFDYASGDENPTDRRIGTFDQLYPLGHAFLGYVDLVGRQNISAWNASLELKPAKGMRLQLVAHRFTRAEAADALYDAGAVVVRPAGAGLSRTIGSEIDLTVYYAFDAHWNFEAGLNRFFAGSFVRQTGRSDAVAFAYAQALYRF